jgi:hypothetical protein
MSSSVKSHVVEQDTEDKEEIPNLIEFLLPSSVSEVFSSSRNQQYAQFNISYNQNIFQGWVKQPSPCCAAASVAGAWNAVHHYSRNHSHALQYENVLEVYDKLIEDKIEKKINSFYRKLGYFPKPSFFSKQDSKDSISESVEECFDLVNPLFWQVFNNHCQSRYGRELAGKKDTLITKKVMEQTLRFVIKESLITTFARSGQNINSFTDLSPDNRSFCYCFAELLETESDSLFIKTNEEDNKESINSDLMEEQKKMNEVDLSDEEVSFSKKNLGSYFRRSDPFRWKKKRKVKILKKMRFW